MGKRLKRAFEIMNERNRRYLEQAAEKDRQNSGAADAAEPDEPNEPDITEKSDSPDAETALSPEEEEELRRAEEKLRAYREANGTNPDAPIPDGLPDPDRIERERKEGERKAKEFHAEKLELEKGDVPALIISALLVFGPIFLVLGAVVVLAWFFLH